MRNDWRTYLYQHIGALGAFRSSDIVEFGQSIDVSKRSIDSELQLLTAQNLLIKIRQGLYVTSELAGDRVNALIAIGNTFQSNGAASLDTSFLTTENRPIHIVVPNGKVGLLKTPIGNIHIHAITKHLTTELIDKVGRDVVYAVDPDTSPSYGQYSPELSICLAAYLTNCGRSEYHPSQLVNPSVMPNINPHKLNKLIKATGIPEEHIDSLMNPAITKNDAPTVRNKDYGPSL